MNGFPEKRLGIAALLTATALLGGGAAAAATQDNAALLAAGERLYLAGLRADGPPLVGTREDGVTLRGAQAACVACHRRSGLGSVEGNTWVPPVTARALFGGAGAEVVVRTSRRFNAATSLPPAPKTADEVMAIVRSGHRADGKPVGDLMPRYALTKRDEAALLAYLQQLGRRPAPGVTPDTIHLATIVTPDVSPDRREALLKTLQTYTQTRNVALFAGKRKRIPHAERLTHSRRRWQLHVWELQGAAETWQAQLAAKHAAQPVFAVLSGTTNTTWTPVTRFCETTRIACWFPTLDSSPQLAATDHFGLYFSEGSALDAAVIAEGLVSAGVRSVAIATDGSPAARRGSDELHRLLPRSISRRELPTATLSPPGANLTDLNEALVVFGGASLAETLAAHAAPTGPVWWAVGEQRNLAVSLPPQWQQRLTLVDRFERDDIRQANLQRFRDWSRVASLPITDERMQAEAYFAANFLSGTLTDMLNNLQPEYLLERAQDTLSMREAETLQMQIQALMMGGGGGHRPVSAQTAEPDGTTQRRAANLELQRSRTSTSLYPRLSLGPDQRFASKGAYLISPNGDARWVVPGRNESINASSNPVSANAVAALPQLSQGAMP